MIAGGWFIFSGSNDSEDAPIAAQEQPVNETTSAPVNEADTTSVAGASDVTEQARGVYDEFSKEKLANASGDVVLFFHSEACSSCKATEKDLSERISDIPEDLTILQLDFNSETPEDIELRKKYGVTTYHTFVQVDANGNEVKNWKGTRSLDAITSEVL